MFVLSTHDWFEPANRMTDAAEEKNINLVTLIIGEEVVVSEEKNLHSGGKNKYSMLFSFYLTLYQRWILVRLGLEVKHSCPICFSNPESSAPII